MEGSFGYQAEDDSFFNITSFLIKIVVACCSIWLIKFLWDWRKLYSLSSKIQGPKGYPIFGNALDFCGKSADELFKKITELFQTYPGIMRVWLGNKLLVVISEPEYLEIVLNHPACLEKGSMYDFTKMYMGNGVFSAPVSVWKKHRKLINPTFNKTILDSFVEVFNQQSKQFLEVLEKNAGKTFDVFPLVSAYNVDNVCETVMGVKLEKPSKFSDYGEHLDLAMRLVLLRGKNIWYHNDFIFNLTGLKKNLENEIVKIRKFTHKVLEDKLKIFNKREENVKLGEEIANQEKWSPLLEYLIQLYKDKKEYTLELIQDEVNTFFAAGTDTSAGTLAFFFLVLGAYPDVQQKIYNEIIEVLGEDRDVTPEDLTKLDYMERALKESMRLFSIAPIIMRTASEDVVLGDTIVPAGSGLFLFSFDTHRNPRYWKDPLKFDPDRFLSEEVAKRHPYAFLPFSGGPRGCIGLKYAMMSMKSLVAMMVRKLIIKSEFKSAAEIELSMNLLLKPKTGFNISVERRAVD